MKRIIKDYLTFSRKERIAVIVLLALMSGFIAAPYLYEPGMETPVISKELADFLAGTAHPENDSITDRSPGKFEPEKKDRAELFAFDPNTIDANGWIRLGVNERTARTIINYRNKGGKFRSAEDIRKIWGLRKEDADRLVPYAVIAGYRPSPAMNKEMMAQQAPVVKEIVPIDINTAGAEEWKSLPGIGEVLANRIVKFRDRVAGFLSVEQVRKTYGISDSLFRAIVPYLVFQPSTVPKLNLNTASVYELRSRTGMSYQLAKTIIDLRDQNGPYQDISFLRSQVSMPDSIWQKVVLLIKTE